MCGSAGCIDYTQLHASDFSVSNEPMTERTSTLHNADMTGVGAQVDLLAESSAVNLAVKRYFEPDPNVAVTKRVKKPKTDLNRQFIPKLSPSLKAKFNRLPSAGGVMLIHSGKVTEFASTCQNTKPKVTPWNTHPSTSYGGSSSSAANQHIPFPEVVPVNQDATMDEDG